MNITHNAETKQLIRALGFAAAVAVAPDLLFGGAGTAHADNFAPGPNTWDFQPPRQDFLPVQ